MREREVNLHYVREEGECKLSMGSMVPIDLDLHKYGYSRAEIRSLGGQQLWVETFFLKPSIQCITWGGGLMLANFDHRD